MKAEIEFTNKDGQRKVFIGKTVKASIDFVTAQIREGNTKVASITRVDNGKGWLLENEDGKIVKHRIIFSTVYHC